MKHKSFKLILKSNQRMTNACQRRQEPDRTAAVDLASSHCHRAASLGEHVRNSKAESPSNVNWMRSLRPVG